MEVSRRAGRPVWIPGDVGGSCCGTPWSSKGFAAGHRRMANATIERLWRWSREGELPVVIDATSCTQGLLEAPAVLNDTNRQRHGRLRLVDSIEWAERLLAAGLPLTRRLDSITVHPSCSATRLGLAPKLRGIAAQVADVVVEPSAAACCGFAGDRGFLHPELTAAALADEAEQVAASSTDAYVCANRTCEIGLRRETGRPYESPIYVLEELSRSG